MRNTLKKYWDIFGGATVGLVYSIAVDWDLPKIQLAYSVIILIIVCIGLFRFFKGKTKKDLMDVVLNTQKCTRAIHIAENPSQEGEKLGNLVLETMKGGKRFMKSFKSFMTWIKNYWQQLVGIGENIVYYLLVAYFMVEEKLGFITELLPQTKVWHIVTYVAFGVIALVFGIFALRNQVKWCGVGSNASAEQYKNGVKVQADKNASGLSKDNRKRLNVLLAEAKKAFKKAMSVEQISDNKYKVAIDSFNAQDDFVKSLESAGVEGETIQSAIAKKEELKLEVSKAGNELNIAKAETAKHEKEVQDYEKVLKK